MEKTIESLVMLMVISGMVFTGCESGIGDQHPIADEDVVIEEGIAGEALVEEVEMEEVVVEEEEEMVEEEDEVLMPEGGEEMVEEEDEVLMPEGEEVPVS